MSGALKKVAQEFPQDGTNLAQEFKTLALRYSEIGSKEGIRVLPFQSPDMPLFMKASEEERKTATQLLRTIVSIHEETLAGGDTATDTRKLIWRALSRYSLVPPSDFFEYITKDETVIIYNGEHAAIFWNLQFFKYSSFSVEQLFFGRWYKMTWREPGIQQKLFKFATEMAATTKTAIFKPDVPGHEVQEMETAENIRTWMEIPWVAVLTQKGSFGGYLAIQKMRIIGNS